MRLNRLHKDHTILKVHGAFEHKSKRNNNFRIQSHQKQRREAPPKLEPDGFQRWTSKHSSTSCSIPRVFLVKDHLKNAETWRRRYTFSSIPVNLHKQTGFIT